MTISNDDLLWERRARVKEQQLKPLLTDVFLNTLAEAARTCGWAVDHAAKKTVCGISQSVVVTAIRHGKKLQRRVTDYYQIS